MRFFGERAPSTLPPRRRRATRWAFPPHTLHSHKGGWDRDQAMAWAAPEADRRDVLRTFRVFFETAGSANSICSLSFPSWERCFVRHAGNSCPTSRRTVTTVANEESLA